MKNMTIRLSLATLLLLPTALWGQTENSVTVYNKGIGGNNTNAGLARFDKDVLALKPQYLILYFGMNDSANSHALVSPENYKANMQKMIDSARKNGISCVIVSLNPVIETYLKKRHPNHPAEDISESQKAYDSIIRKLAADNNIPLVDLRTLVLEHSKSLEDKDSFLRNMANSKVEDGVHLTAEGYCEFAKLFEPVFKGKIKRGDVVVCFGDSLTFGANMKGAGTATGDTYPAHLSEILNRLASE